MSVITAILSFVFALGVIIFVHEFGHLAMAKVFNTRVLTFSLGFGKRIWGFERGETDYRVSLVPLGGYVKLGGELPEESTGDPREFLAKPRWQRILVYLAGPAMNVALSLVLIAIVFMIGIELPNLAGMEPVVAGVEEGSSAEAAGLEPGDRVVTANGEEIANWDDLSLALITSPEKPVALQVRRDGETFAATVTPGKLPGYELGDSAGLYAPQRPQVTTVTEGSPAERAGFEPGDLIRALDGRPVADQATFIRYIEQRAGSEVAVTVLRDGRDVVLRVTPADQGGVGKIGTGIGVFQRYGPARAFVESAKYNWNVVTQTFDVLGKIVSGRLSAKSSLSGPIEIANYTGAAAQAGFKYLLHLMGFISISIAILNLLPIPVLDGGQILVLLIESTIRRDLSMRFKELISQVGFVLIMLLMLAVIYFDISKGVARMMSG